MSRSFYRIAVRPGPGKALSFDSTYTLDRAGFAEEGWSLWRIALRSELKPVRPSRLPWKSIALADFHEFARRTAEAVGGSVLAVRVETSDWGYVAGLTSDGHEGEALINSYIAADSSSDGRWAVQYQLVGGHGNWTLIGPDPP
jgi:hypothetical protein